MPEDPRLIMPAQSDSDKAIYDAWVKSVKAKQAQPQTWGEAYMQMGDVGHSVLKGLGLNPFGQEDPNAYHTFINPKTGKVETVEMKIGVVPFMGFPEGSGASSFSQRAAQALEEKGGAIRVGTINGKPATNIPARPGAAPPIDTISNTGSYLLDAHGNWWLGRDGKTHIQMLWDSGLLGDKEAFAKLSTAQQTQVINKVLADNQLIRSGAYGRESMGAEIWHEPTQAQMKALHASMQEAPYRKWYIKAGPGGKAAIDQGFQNGGEALNSLRTLYPEPAPLKLMPAHSATGPATRFGKPGSTGTPGQVSQFLPEDIRKIVNALANDPANPQKLDEAFQLMRSKVNEHGLAAVDRPDIRALGEAWERGMKQLNEHMGSPIEIGNKGVYVRTTPDPVNAPNVIKFPVRPQFKPPKE